MCNKACTSHGGAVHNEVLLFEPANRHPRHRQPTLALFQRGVRLMSGTLTNSVPAQHTCSRAEVLSDIASYVLGLGVSQNERPPVTSVALLLRQISTPCNKQADGRRHIIKVPCATKSCDLRLQFREREFYLSFTGPGNLRGFYCTICPS